MCFLMELSWVIPWPYFRGPMPSGGKKYPDVRRLTVMKYEPDEERVIRTHPRLSGLLVPTRRRNSTTRHLSNGPNVNDAAQNAQRPHY
jgi:hypothetical protein